MKTLIFEMIDGLQIVKGFGKLQINPVRTQANQQSILDESPEMAAYKTAVDTIHGIVPPVKKNEREKARWAREMKDATDISRPALDAVNEFKKNNLEAGYAYMEPRRNEITDFDESLRDKFKSIKPRQELLISGEVIQDNRGIDYWYKEDDRWCLNECTKLGDAIPKNSKMYLDHSDADRSEILAQRETDRITALTPEARETERQAQLSAAAAQAAMNRSVDEIKGTSSSEALENARTNYQSAIVEIETRYL